MGFYVHNFTILQSLFSISFLWIIIRYLVMTKVYTESIPWPPYTSHTKILVHSTYQVMIYFATMVRKSQFYPQCMTYSFRADHRASPIPHHYQSSSLHYTNKENCLWKNMQNFIILLKLQTIMTYRGHIGSAVLYLICIIGYFLILWCRWYLRTKGHEDLSEIERGSITIVLLNYISFLCVSQVYIWSN